MVLRSIKVENENNPIANDMDFKNNDDLSEKWKLRFQFFNDYGYPGVFIQTKEWRDAYRKLPFLKRFKIGFNVFAVFFGIIYLLILGLWKKAIVCFAILIVISIICSILDLRMMGIFFNVFVASRVNAWYYDRKVKGKQDWSL